MWKGISPKYDMWAESPCSFISEIPPSCPRQMMSFTSEVKFGTFWYVYVSEDTQRSSGLFYQFFDTQNFPVDRLNWQTFVSGRMV